MNSKAKGNVGEREFERILTARGIRAERNEQGLLAGFCGGEHNPDVLAEIRGQEIHFEVKRTEKLRLHDAIRQAEHDAQGRIPIVAHRGNREPWRVTLSLDDFLQLTV